MVSSPVVVLYVRSEIASGSYDFPITPADSSIDPPAATTEDEANAPPPPPVVRFPGVPADHEAGFFPDGHIVSAIRMRLRASGLRVLEERMVQFTKPEVRRLYFASDGDSEATRSACLDGWTRGPTLALLLSLEITDIAALHAFIGPDDPVVARQEALAAGLPVDQWPVRARCGLSTLYPGVVVSATLDCALRERHQLFSAPADPPLDSAVVVLLPPLLAAIPDAKVQLLEAFNRHGVVVTTQHERSQLVAAADVTILAAATDATAHDALAAAAADGTTLVLRVVGFHLAATLLDVLGPTTSAEAQRYFPQSLGARVASSLIDHVRLETSVVVSFDPHTIAALAPEDETVTSTFAIIKPNATRDPAAVAAIRAAMRSFGFEVVRHARLRLSRADASAFYAEHLSKAFFERLVAFMTSGEIVALHLRRKLAVPMWRALMGPTNCLVARMTYPWTLRARFGVDGTQNATHGSDAAASARRELRFFFGASAANAPIVPTLAVAPVANALVRTNGETLQQIVVQGLDALLQQHQHQQQQQLGDDERLDACRWLGEWLLQQREQPQDDFVASDNKTTTKVVGKKPTKTVGNPTTTKQANDTHRIVAIVVDATVSPTTKDNVRQWVRDRVDRIGGAFVDVGDVGNSSLADRVANVGLRRVVLFDCALQAVDSVAPTLIVTLTTSGQSTVCHSSAPHVRIEIPALVDDPLSLQTLFRTVVDPRVVLLITDEKCGRPRCQHSAERAGFLWLSFDAVVTREMERENDPLGAFTQWKRTGATLAQPLVLDALRRAIADPATLGLAAAAHKFVIVGFPWESLDARALEQSVGRIECVVDAGGYDRTWGQVFEKRGAVVHCEDPTTVDKVLSRVLMPNVTFALGADGVVDAIKQIAIDGAVWIDAATFTTGSVDATIDNLRSIVLRASVPHKHLLVRNFPWTPDEATTFLTSIATPRAVLVVGSPTPALDSVLEVLQREAPHAIQSFVPPTVSPSRLRGLLSPVRVAVAVGDCGPLDARTLRKTLAVIGVSLVDMRDHKHPHDAETTLVAVASVPTPRCLVLYSGAIPIDLVTTLQARLGDAVFHLFVLKQRIAAPPPVRRPGDDDDYDSDDEREREVVRQREAVTLAPELARLVEVSKASNALRVHVVSYLHATQAQTQLVSALLPQVVSVRGNALSFYRDAVRTVCRTLHVPFVDVRNVTTDLHSVLTTCGSRVVVVDGFPRAMSQAPYAAQQLLALETTGSATVPLLVRFTTSLDVLMEKYPSVGRNALEDAQDAAEDFDVDAAFATRHIHDVSCERELQDAQDAFIDVLTTTGLVDKILT